MATDLFIISNIKTTKEEVVAKKDIYLQQLKALNLDPFHYPIVVKTNPYKIEHVEAKGEWKYEFPIIYDENKDSMVPDEEDKEIIYFSSPTPFNVGIYPNCLMISTIYRYRFLYSEYELEPDSYLWEFRKNVFDIISIFGGAEIIYLADNACNKLAEYLECKVWEGVSYDEIKRDMEEKELTFVSDYHQLKLENLRYGNITEIVFDKFEDLKI